MKIHLSSCLDCILIPAVAFRLLLVVLFRVPKVVLV